MRVHSFMNSLSRHYSWKENMSLFQRESAQGVEEGQITAEREQTEGREGDVEAVVKEMRQTKVEE